jgi:hypothetical protein
MKNTYQSYFLYRLAEKNEIKHLQDTFKSILASTILRYK